MFERFTESSSAYEETKNAKNGVEYMKKVMVSNGDTVGIAVQQSDLPMLQFFLNGEPLHDLAITRFRGSVYPCKCICVGPIFYEGLIFVNFNLFLTINS